MPVKKWKKLCRYADQSTIGARWVAKKKADGTVKVTLIAMGYQENRLEK